MDPIILKQLGKTSCTVDNIRIMRGNVIRLTMIRDMALADMRQAEREKSTASLANHVLFGLQMVKATCDVVLGVAGEWSRLVKPVSAAYSEATPYAESAGKLVAGQFGAADLAKSANTGIHDIIKKKLGKDYPVGDSADYNKIKTDILINATAYDEKAVLASLWEMGALFGSWAVKAAGKEAMGRVFKTGDEIRKAGLAYHGAYKEWKEGDASSSFDAGIRILRRQVDTIARQIQMLESNLAACGADMPKFKPSAIDTIKSLPPAGPAFRAGR